MIGSKAPVVRTHLSGRIIDDFPFEFYRLPVPDDVADIVFIPKDLANMVPLPGTAARVPDPPFIEQAR